uniref:Uncharacterized protein n=1 Tax=Macaca fascicularis TaxID=9541 RepID=A0A7N9D3A9_MACFA
WPSCSGHRAPFPKTTSERLRAISILLDQRSTWGGQGRWITIVWL